MNDSVIIRFILMLIFVQWVWLFNDRGRTNRRIRALQARYIKLTHHLGIEDVDPLEPSGEVKALACSPGQHIAAIKLYREQTGAELKEAVEVIKQLERSIFKVMP